MAKQAQQEKNEAAASATRGMKKAKAKAAWVATGDIVEDLDTYIFVENGNRLPGMRSVALKSYEIATVRDALKTRFTFASDLLRST